MSGNEVPSDDILRENLHKRLYFMEHESGHTFEKRFNRVGTPGFSPEISIAGAKAVNSAGRVSVDEAVGGGIVSVAGKLGTVMVFIVYGS